MVEKMKNRSFRFRRSWLKRTGGAEGAFSVGFPGAVSANEGGVALERVDFIDFAGFGQLTEMQFMIFRVGAQVINIR